MDPEISRQTEGRFLSRDHLSLFYREFGRRDAVGTSVLCLPGLTRNSKDFVALASRLALHHRVLCPDLRGRGRSQRDPNQDNYHPHAYLEDIWELLATTDTPQVVVIGTSLGGLLAMMMAAVRPERVAGVVLNDVGPEISPEGLTRITEYIGRLPQVHDWTQAVAQCKQVYGLALPDLTEEQWEQFTRRQYAEDASGMIRLEYDPRLGDALRSAGGELPNAWSLFHALSHVPTLAFRGAISDILSARVFDKMAKVKPDLKRVVVPDRGHVPLLDEPECREALEDFFAAYRIGQVWRGGQIPQVDAD
jgi:pimeloyl-ACP methyl ester carboxylesterase